MNNSPNRRLRETGIHREKDHAVQAPRHCGSLDELMIMQLQTSLPSTAISDEIEELSYETQTNIRHEGDQQSQTLRDYLKAC